METAAAVLEEIQEDRVGQAGEEELREGARTLGDEASDLAWGRQRAGSCCPHRSPTGS